MTLTKKEITEKIREQLSWWEYSKQDAERVFETMIEIMKRTMEDGDDILISGFGKFEVKEKRERRGRNPATGESMQLKPRRVVTFKCSGKLRDKVNGGEK